MVYFLLILRTIQTQGLRLQHLAESLTIPMRETDRCKALK
jgi:hypothetical protein